jgi:excisionase family DNA binding protein
MPWHARQVLDGTEWDRMKTERAFERNQISESEKEGQLRQRLAAAPEPRRTYSVEEAGRILGVCRNSAYALAKSGELPTIRLGRRLLVPRAALERLLAND